MPLWGWLLSFVTALLGFFACLIRGICLFSSLTRSCTWLTEWLWVYPFAAPIPASGEWWTISFQFWSVRDQAPSLFVACIFNGYTQWSCQCTCSSHQIIRPVWGKHASCKVTYLIFYIACYTKVAHWASCTTSCGTKKAGSFVCCYYWSLGFSILVHKMNVYNSLAQYVE